MAPRSWAINNYFSPFHGCLICHFYELLYTPYVFRESNFSRIGTSIFQDIFASDQIRDRGGEQWTDRRLIYFRVLLNSRKAPTREIRENKTPAKYMAYTVFLTCYKVEF